MITISIEEEVETAEDMSYLLQEIARLIQNGYTSGVYPSWRLEGEEETSKLF